MLCDGCICSLPFYRPIMPQARRQLCNHLGHGSLWEIKKERIVTSLKQKGSSSCLATLVWVGSLPGLRSRHKPSHKKRARRAQTMAGNSEGPLASFLKTLVKNQTALNKGPPPGPPHKPWSSSRVNMCLCVEPLLKWSRIWIRQQFPRAKGWSSVPSTYQGAIPSTPFSYEINDTYAQILSIHAGEIFLARIFQTSIKCLN